MTRGSLSAGTLCFRKGCFQISCISLLPHTGLPGSGCWSLLAWARPISGPPSHLHSRHKTRGEAKPCPHPPWPLPVRAPRGTASTALHSHRELGDADWVSGVLPPVICFLPPNTPSPPMLSALVHATPSVCLHKPETLGLNLDTSFSFSPWRLIAKPCQFHLLNIPELLHILLFLSRALSSPGWTTVGSPTGPLLPFCLTQTNRIWMFGGVGQGLGPSQTSWCNTSDEAATTSLGHSLHSNQDNCSETQI